MSAQAPDTVPDPASAPAPEAVPDAGASDGISTITQAPLPQTNAPTPEASGVAGADALREAVVENTGSIGTWITWLDSFGFNVADTRVSLWSVAVVLLVIVGVYLFARIMTWAGRLALKRIGDLDVGQKLLVDKLMSVAVWGIAIMIGIDVLGIDLTALAVFSGAFGLAVGFGLQKTFGNLLAGIILLMDKSIKPGDVISVTDNSGADGFGQIRKIGMRAISVVTRDQAEYLIPNENLMTNQVVNWSYSSRDVRVKAPIGVAYGSDLDLVEKLLYESVTETSRILANPKPRVNIMGFGDSSVDFEVRFWIQDPEEGMANIRSDVYQRIWRKFKEHDVEIPFPQRDLNLRNNDQFQQLVEAISQRVNKGD